VLGEPPLVTTDDRRDAEGEALLREDGVAAVARPERPHLEGVGVVHDVLLVVAGPGGIRLAGLEGAPTVCTVLTQGLPAAICSRTSVPTRVMMPIEVTA
jgi:hypothetical protein